MSLEMVRMTVGMVLAELYVADQEGNDATGDGTKEKPFKTGLKALMTLGKEPFPNIYVDSQKENELSLSLKPECPGERHEPSGAPMPWDGGPKIQWTSPCCPCPATQDCESYSSQGHSWGLRYAS
ncbi:Asparaginyl-tRNA synthetase, cytoplasmic [Heterocephalus glaber]|uniref:Asparaginyl-tRNA synthetase, cytoplasmic n=1 Tax=Heterocephalus glaber TaxID=10181 RepID=G5BMK6_HETGA|nr:Asparaginyl-tRNA synthetase, cytoplasmic [Heterocephalus glaber]